ncbi:MAG: inositol monophosphatase family protein [Planctomycetia bacterium]|nr:inositol monophosphatase family protein [Planctomycetia bacterium]
MTTDDSAKVYLETALSAAHAAGKVLLEMQGHCAWREKRPADLVTEADTTVQKIVADILLTQWPEHAFIGEEAIGMRQLAESECGSGATKELPLTWIVDPLDGTTNFVHQFPMFCTSIALAQGNDLLCAVVYNPVTGECFTASRGGGAFVNGQAIHVSRVTRPAESLTSFSLPPQVTASDPEFIDFMKIISFQQAMRRTGSTALNLAFVAAGRLDIAVCRQAHPWDVAAGALLVQEAGGLLCHPDGQPFDLGRAGTLATATAELQQAVIDKLK